MHQDINTYWEHVCFSFAALRFCNICVLCVYVCVCVCVYVCACVRILDDSLASKSQPTRKLQTKPLTRKKKNSRHEDISKAARRAACVGGGRTTCTCACVMR
ncbi:hypothetical protein Micbo1qcDRAFT_5399 [Microdochium bolleyi]|uniref:Uncharacterized protein n=1 Tax=Microdochium bolleyi TaxID=196109 RepID=A0A136JIX5_9PEZI|nr:hypothetical protein Micbo1qcDRAFT_5399 [Microdochium bolleyi]